MRNGLQNACGGNFFVIYHIGWDKVGMVGMSPAEFIKWKRKRQKTLEKFKTVKIPKKCRDCNKMFDINDFPLYRGKYNTRCKKCFTEYGRLASIKRRAKLKKVDTVFKVKKQKYKVLCSGSGFAKRLVTIEARNEKEARAKAMEIGFVPIEVRSNERKR